MKMVEKKLIALALVAIMALTFMPFAALANGTGGTVYVETERLNVTLPTAEAFNFWLDPQGLLGLEPGVTATPGELEQHAGKIIFPSNFAPTVVNKSSVPIDVGITMEVTGSATSVDEDLHDAGYTETVTSLRIQAFHAGTNAFLTDTATTTDIVATTTSVPAAQTIFIEDSDGSTPTSHQLLYLEEASYLISNLHSTATSATIQEHIDNGTFNPDLYSFAPDIDTPDFQGAQFMLSGILNKNADTDWTPFAYGTSSVGLEFRYAFKKSVGTAPATEGFAFVSTQSSMLFDSQPIGFLVGNIIRANDADRYIHPVTVSAASLATNPLMIPFYAGDEGIYQPLTSGVAVGTPADNKEGAVTTWNFSGAAVFNGNMIDVEIVDGSIRVGGTGWITMMPAGQSVDRVIRIRLTDDVRFEIALTIQN